MSSVGSVNFMTALNSFKRDRADILANEGPEVTDGLNLDEALSGWERYWREKGTSPCVEE